MAKKKVSEESRWGLINSADFSKEQLQAINHYKGPALVIAGPGSGKTYTIVNRILNLILNHKVNPDKILVITFSKTAVNDMLARFSSVCANHYYPVIFGTFHSVFFNIVRQYKGIDSKNIISMSYRRKLIYDILKHYLPNALLCNDYLDIVLRRISYYKNSGYIEDREEDCNLEFEKFVEIVDQYDCLLKDRNKVDFEDMMLLCKEILLKDESVRTYYQSRFEHILIDEFQDINDLQFEVVKLLLNKDRNLFAVGDDDQSIYGFRGAKPRIMLNIKAEFSNLKIIRLSCNYRSTKNIVRCASIIINDNKNRYSKNIYSNNELGDKVVCSAFDDIYTQADYIVSNIKNILCDNNKSNIAILFRTNSESIFLSQRLLEERIEFTSKEKLYNIYESMVYKDFHTYLLLANCKYRYDGDMLQRIINKPVRYVDTRLFTTSTISVEELILFYKDKNYIVNHLKKLVHDLKFISSLDMYSAFYYFRKVIGYEEYIEKRFQDNSELLYMQRSIIASLTEQMRLFASFKDMQHRVNRLSQRLDSVSMSNRTDCNVHLMTFHASKGLEYDYVFIPGINEGKIPNHKSLCQEDIEEERRMFYVACTRAKNKLFLSYIKGTKNDKHIRSRFLQGLLASDCIKDDIISLQNS